MRWYWWMYFCSHRDHCRHKRYNMCWQCWPEHTWFSLSKSIGSELGVRWCWGPYEPFRRQVGRPSCFTQQCPMHRRCYQFWWLHIRTNGIRTLWIWTRSSTWLHVGCSSKWIIIESKNWLYPFIFQSVFNSNKLYANQRLPQTYGNSSW